MPPNIQLFNADCLDVLKTLDAGSVDAIITDLPYGTTACEWDEVIPFAPMWAEVKRLLKPRGAFVTTASQPFTSALVMSNPKWFKHELIWSKGRGFEPQLANVRPMKSHENVLVFCRGSAPYNPQMVERDNPYTATRKTLNRGDGKGQNLFNSPPQSKTYTHAYPISVMDMGFERGLHPTQKPVALYEYLIRTYTNEGDTVLDFTMGSGTTGVACVKTGRNFIGVEIDAGYFAIAEKRIAEARLQLPLLEVT